MKENEVKISVIIRTYNSAKYVKEAIDSILKQTIEPDLYEIVVVDDGSTDNTKDILDLYKNRIKLIEQEHKGAIQALNTGIKKAQGIYVILLDADDMFTPQILEKMLNVFEKSKGIDFVYCDYHERDMETGKQRIISLRDNIFHSVAGGIMFKKKILEESGMYNENLIFPEYDLLIKLQKKYKGEYIPHPLFVYRRYSKSITADKEKVRMGKEQLFAKYGPIKGLRDY